MQWLRNFHACWRIKRSGRFDSSYYANQEPKGVSASITPIWHYVTSGWKDGLNPNESFDTIWYMNAYPDVKKTADTLHPFVHYIDHGFGEARQPSECGVSYSEWISVCERYDEQQLQNQLASLAYQPLISLVVPVFKPDRTHLEQCVRSLLDQSYGNWELCISDDASGDDDLEQYLRTLSINDTRIKIIFREANGNISANTNSALTLATGEFVALLDQDDELSIHALYEIVSRLNQNQNAKILYSDEDKIDEEGQRSSPHFKPDWNVDLLYSTNYISHLGVYKRGLLEKIGGLRLGYEGSQDYDLVLRCSALVKAQEVVHIPKVLYHWRASPGSTAQSAEEKPFTWDAGLRALKDFMVSQDSKIRVNPGPYPNTYRVQWPVRGESPLVTLIIPTRDGGKVLRKCIKSILKKTEYGNYEILVIDNQSSSRDTLAYLRKMQKDPRISVLPFDEPFNFSKLVNFGVSKARGEYIALVNDDIEVISPDWLDEMLGLASREEVGCVGAKLYYPDNSIQHAGVILGVNGVAGHAHKHFARTARGYSGRLVLTQDLSAVTAACLMVRKSIFQTVGGFDESNLTVAFNDIDFCLKVLALGYRNIWTPWAELYHHESMSRGPEDTEEKRVRFMGEVEYMKTRWASMLAADPAYSPNLTRDHDNFAIAIPSSRQSR